MKNGYYQETKAFFISFIGITVLGLSITLISWRYTLITRGLPGYALALNYLTHTPVGTALFIANTVILVLALLVAGKSAGIKGFLGYAYLSLVIDGSKSLFRLSQTVLPSLPVNILLYVVQGAVAAAAIGCVVHNRYSFGSYSSILPIFYKFRTIHPPVFFLVMDAILAAITAYFFGIPKGLFLLVNAGAFFLVFDWMLRLLKNHG